MYDLVSPYAFHTRLAMLHLTEVTRKKPREYDLKTFFVEDNTMVANRTNSKVIKNKNIHPVLFDEVQSVRNDFFQYMIGNADWSSVEQHNSNTLHNGTKYIPLSYDFDMSGFVDAGYAHQNAPTLGTGNPRERVYRGFCKSQDAMEKVRKEFLEKEKAVHAAIDAESAAFDEYQLKDMHAYIDEFYTIMKDDRLFADKIIGQCRTR
jgi:hypothetical protein